MLLKNLVVGSKFTRLDVPPDSEEFQNVYEVSEIKEDCIIGAKDGNRMKFDLAVEVKEIKE